MINRWRKEELLANVKKKRPMSESIGAEKEYKVFYRERASLTITPNNNASNQRLGRTILFLN